MVAMERVILLVLCLACTSLCLEYEDDSDSLSEHGEIRLEILRVRDYFKRKLRRLQDNMEARIRQAVKQGPSNMVDMDTLKDKMISILNSDAMTKILEERVADGIADQVKSGEIKVVVDNNIHYQLHLLKQQLKTILKRSSEAAPMKITSVSESQQIDQLKDQLALLRNEAMQEKEKLDEVTETLTNLQKKSHQQHDLIGSLTNDLKDQKSQVSDVKRKQEVTSQQNDQLKNQLALLRNKAIQEKEKLDEVTETLSNLKEKSHQQHDLIGNLTNELKDQISQVSDVKRKQEVTSQQFDLLKALLPIQTKQVREKFDEVTETLSNLLKKSHQQHDLIGNLTNDLKDQKSVISSNGNQISRFQDTGGAVFTRWGRTVCPTGNDLVYRGFAAGSHYSHKGGSSNLLCLPENPIYDHNTVGHTRASVIYGTEYETHYGHHFKHLHNHDVPCSVCRSQKHRSIIMLPARNQCLSGWKREFSGFLMGGFYVHPSTNDFVCVDAHAESSRAGHANKDGSLLYMTQSSCGSLPCPPYQEGRELSCVVCTKK